MRYSGGKFKLASPPTVQHPDVVLPLQLLLLIPACAVWLTVALGYFLFLQVEASRLILSAPKMAVLALIGGIAPVVISWALATNQWWSKQLIIAVAVAGPLLLQFALPGLSLPETALASLLLGVVAIALTTAPVSSRAYYYALTGRPLSADMEHALDSSDKAGTILRRFSAVGPVLEVLIVLFVLASVAFAILQAWG